MVTGIQMVKIAARIGRSVRTVGRVYKGLGNGYSRDAVKAAATELGLPLPPEPSLPSSPEPSPTSSSRAA